jgi:hypothetical protein
MPGLFPIEIIVLHLFSLGIRSTIFTWALRICPVASAFKKKIRGGHTLRVEEHTELGFKGNTSLVVSKELVYIETLK